MIKLEMSLIPYGSRLYPEAELITATIFSYKNKHCYVIKDNVGTHLFEGNIPKTQSGHRNPLRMLADILEDCDLEILGTNHITTEYDVYEQK